MSRLLQNVNLKVFQVACCHNMQKFCPQNWCRCWWLTSLVKGNNTRFGSAANHGSSPPPVLLPPLNFSGGPKNFRPKWLGDLSKKLIFFRGEANKFKGNLKFSGDYNISHLISKTSWWKSFIENFKKNLLCLPVKIAKIVFLSACLSVKLQWMIKVTREILLNSWVLGVLLCK